MSIIDSAVLTAMGGEGIERLIHDTISKGMLDAANEGRSDAEIAASGLKATEHQSIFKKVSDDVPGLTSTMFSAAIAEKLRTFNYDRLLPGNNHPGVVAARFLMKEIVPHIVVGAGEGIGDKLSRAIDNAVGKVRSNTDLPAPKKAGKGSCDSVCWVKPNLGQRDAFFFIEFEDKENTIPLYHTRIDHEGHEVKTTVPMCRGSEFQRIKAQWDANHGRRKEKVPNENWQNNQQGKKGGNNQPREKEGWVDAEDLPCEIISFDVAIRRISENLNSISPELAEAIKDHLKKPEKPKEWAEQLTDATKRVMVAFSRTQKDLGWLDKVTAENLVKHLEEKQVSIVHMTTLGNEFDSKILPNGKLTMEDYLTMVMFIDDWMGADITRVNSIRLAIARARATHVNWREVIPTFFFATGFMWLFLMAIAWTFVGSFFLFVVGSIHDTARPLDLYFAHYSAGRWPAFAATVVGMWTISLLMFVMIKFTQPFLNWATLIVPHASKDGLERIGHKVNAFFGAYGPLAALMILINSPLAFRAVPLLVTSFAAIGVAAMYYLSGNKELVAAKLYKAAVWFERINIIFPFAIIILLSILGIFGITPMIAGDWIREGFRFVRDNPLAQTVLFGLLVAIPGHFILKKVEMSKWTKDGIVYEGRMPSKFARIILIALFLLATVGPWSSQLQSVFQSSNSPAVTGSAVSTSGTAVFHTAIPQAKSSVPASKIRQSRTRHKAKTADDPCHSELSYDAKRDLHCPCCP